MRSVYTDESTYGFVRDRLRLAKKWGRAIKNGTKFNPTKIAHAGRVEADLPSMLHSRITAALGRRTGAAVLADLLLPLREAGLTLHGFTGTTKSDFVAWLEGGW